MSAPLPAAISAVCVSYFGTYRGHGKWSPPNRCDSCPLRDPCMTWGASPAHTLEQLDEGRAVFVAAAEALLAGGVRNTSMKDAR